MGDRRLDEDWAARFAGKEWRSEKRYSEFNTARFAPNLKLLNPGVFSEN